MNLTPSNRLPRIALVLCTIAVLHAPAARAQETKPFAAFSQSAQTLRDSVVQMAKAQVGKRYRFGGTSPEKGFDCSGLVKYVMAALNFDLPRTAKQQAREGLAVAKDTNGLLPGDLLTFGKTKKSAVSHIGIYIGDGRYIHASSTAGRVVESSIDRPYSPLIKIWRGARRILAFEDTVEVPAATTAIIPPPAGSN
ncbi:MAG TPA: C40 family peptidase [Gemmatimonadaceae bacterium]